MNRLFSPILTGLVLLITAYPFVWMFLSSFKTNREIYQPGKMLPESFDPFAYKLLFSGELFDFTAVLVRSLLLAGGQAIFACLVTAATGFALAKGRFRGKTLLFWAALLIILYPKQAMSLALFEWMARLEITGNLYGLMLSGVASGLGVIFFTQVFRKVPDELIDLAKVEGQSPFFLLFHPAPLNFSSLVHLWNPPLFSLLAGTFTALTDPRNGSTYLAPCPGQIGRFHLPYTRSGGISGWSTSHDSSFLAFWLLF